MHSRMFLFLLPAAVIATVFVVMIGIGALFTVVGNTATIGIGLGIIVGTLVIGFLVSKETKASP